MTFAVQVNGLTAISNPVPVEVFDCNDHVIFGSLSTSYSAYVGQTFPAIIAIATSTNADCVISSTTYTLNTPASGVSMTTSGAMTVGTANKIY